MKLCIFNAAYLTQIGGIESHIDTLSKSLTGDFDVTIVSGSGSEIFQKNPKIVYFVFPFLNRKNFLNKFFSRFFPSFFSSFQIECVSFWFSSFLHFLRNDYDVIHFHQPIDSVFFNFLRHFRNFSTVLTVHGFPTPLLKNQIKKNNKIIAVSESVKNFLITNYSINSGVLLNPIDCFLFKPLPKNKHLIKKFFLQNSFTLLLVGRLVEWKGFQYVIQAMPEVLKLIPNAKLLIVGSGEFESELISLVKKKNLQNNVIFAGQANHDQIPEFFSVCDIFLQPSIAMESFSLTLVSAQLSGKPCIASDLGALKEFVLNGKNGFLVPPQNSEAIAEKVIELFFNKKLRNSIQLNSKKNLEKFDSIKLSKKFVQLFSSLQ